MADFVLSRGHEAQSMSISELAEASGVAEATISRFCRRLKCNGFAAFKLAIATSAASISSISTPLTGEVTNEDTVPGLARKLAVASMDAILESEALIDPDTVRAAVDVLLRADKVLCMGQGGSTIMAQEASHLFSTSFSGYFHVADSHLQAIYASQLTERDAILYFSYSGATTALADVLRIVREQRAASVLITRYPKSPGAELADIVLQCGSRESPLQLGSIPARVAQLYLIDVLYAEMSRRDLRAWQERRARVAGALSGLHL